MLDSILNQLGAATALIAGLGAFLKAMLLARDQRLIQIDLEKLRAETSRDLATLNASFVTQAELLRFNLKTQKLVGGKQFAKEFEAYEIIWEHVELIFRAASTITQMHELGLGDITKVVRDNAANDLSKPWVEFEAVLRKYAPFIHESAYGPLQQFRSVFGRIWSEDQLFESLFDMRATSGDLEVARDRAMSAIRARLGLAKTSVCES